VDEFASDCARKSRAEMRLETRISGSSIPEVDLMLCCARTCSTPQTRVRIKEIATQGVDWRAFVQLATSHGVRPLVYQSLHSTCWEVLPEATRQELSRFHSANSAKNRFLAGELLHILQLFEAEHILAVPFKGPVLAAVLYGDLALREFTDLDILIRGPDIPKAREILSNLGYRSSMASGVITPDVNVDELHSALTGISVELHWQFSPRRFVSSLAAEHVWNGIEPIVILGRQVWSFSSQDLFLFLAVHGGKHSWSSLKWLCDLAEFIRSNPELDWPRLFKRADALGAARTCRLGIYLAAELMQAEVPSSVVCAVREDAQVRLLAQEVRERIQETRDVDPIEGQIFNLRLKERFRDKVRYFFLQCSQYSGEEERFLPLPSTLSFIYIFVRPIWLLRRYGFSVLKRMVR
jgi:Uncharacterised nucleotidyltransferase